MRAMVMDRLRVPGAVLHYEVRGRGPALLLIPGGPADGGVFADLADRLEDRYTVITYDPRGLSRSTFEGGPADLRVEVHADDAARLIAAVDEGPAYVFATGGGAVYGLDLTAHYPDHVRALVAHEPPLSALLPDVGRWHMLHEDVRSTCLTQGAWAAMTLFDEGAGFAGDEPSDSAPYSGEVELFERIERNMPLYVRVLLPSMADYVPAIDVLRTGRPQVVVAAGEASGDHMPFRAAFALSRRLGTATSLFPGSHAGFGTDPDAFAERLHEVLSASGR